MITLPTEFVQDVANLATFQRHLFYSKVLSGRLSEVPAVLEFGNWQFVTESVQKEWSNFGLSLWS